MAQDQATSNFKTHRWLLQALLCIIFTGQAFLMIGFAVASQTITEYFQAIALKEYEILSRLSYFCGVPVAVVVAANGSKLQSRSLIIGSSSLLVLSAVLSSVGFMSTSSFWLVVLGWITAGAASGITYVTPMIIADIYFSSEFAAVTYGLALASLYLGSIASYLSFSKVTNVVRNQIPAFEFHVNSYIVTQTFVSGFGMITLFLFASAMLLCLCFNHVTIDDQERVDEPTEGAYKYIRQCCRSDCVSNFEARRLLQPFASLHHILLLIANFLAASTEAYALVKMPDILSMLHPTVQPETITIVYISAMVGGIIGCLLACYANFKYFIPAVLSACSAAISLLLAIGICVSFYWKSYVGASVCSVVLSVSVSHLTISLLVDFLSIPAPHLDRITVASLYFASFNAGMMLFNWLTLIFSEYGITEACILLMIITMLPVPILILLTKCTPSVSIRSENVRSSESDRVNETTYLVTSLHK